MMAPAIVMVPETSGISMMGGIVSIRRPMPRIIIAGTPTKTDTYIPPAMVRPVIPWVVEPRVIVETAAEVVRVVVGSPDRIVPSVRTIPVRRVEHLEVPAVPVRVVLGNDRLFIALFVVVVLRDGHIFVRLVYHNAVGLLIDLVLSELQLRVAAASAQAQQRDAEESQDVMRFRFHFAMWLPNFVPANCRHGIRIFSQTPFEFPRYHE